MTLTTVDVSPLLAQQLKREGADVRKRVVQFIVARRDRKKQFGKYKQSGRKNGYIFFPPYEDLYMWHFHVGDYDPLLAVQDFGLDYVWALALTSHAEMFNGNEANFLLNHDEYLAEPDPDDDEEMAGV